MTLQQWLEDKKRLCEVLKVDVFGPEEAVVHAIADVSRMARSLPQALRIIEAVRDRAADDGPIYDGEVDDIAERVINEKGQA